MDVSKTSFLTPPLMARLGTKIEGTYFELTQNCSLKQLLVATCLLDTFFIE